MDFKKLLMILIFSGGVLVWRNVNSSGFGISPPYLKNDHLVPGSHFEQTITLTRSEPKEPLKITIEIEAPEIENWIKVDKGKEFEYPANLTQFPINFIVDVPEDAAYGTYYGKITIKAAPIAPKGQVTVAIGAQAEIKLKVSGEVFSDFKIMRVSIPAFEEGWPLKFIVTLKNIGNVKTRPSKVHLDIYDNFHQRLLKSGDIINMSWIDPFKVGESVGEMKVNLKSGQYWAEYEIYKDDELKVKDKIRFNVHLPGTLRPKPIFKRISDFLTASPLRLVLTTFFGTLILVTILLGLISYFKKRKSKVQMQ
jgi:hypothetical protein